MTDCIWPSPDVAAGNFVAALRALNLQDRMTGLEQAVQCAVQPTSGLERTSAPDARMRRERSSLSFRMLYSRSELPVSKISSSLFSSLLRYVGLAGIYSWRHLGERF